WGANIYIGYSFNKSPIGNCFGQFAKRSKKPLWVSEYGVDAWDNVNNREYQDKQAEWVGNNWDEIAASAVCIGATLMAYSDEWWKSGSPDSHDYGGWSTAQWGKLHPDDYANEEWWGVVAVEKAPGSIDKVYPRKVYYALLEKWAEEYDLEAKYSAEEPVVVDKEYMKKEGIIKVTASSNHPQSLSPEAAVDGNFSTRWESEHNVDPVWLVIELDKEQTIENLKIVWETASALKYDIQLSTDFKKWTTVSGIDDGKKGEKRIIEFKPARAKYIRIYGKERVTQWGYSIWEIKINAKQLPSLPQAVFSKPQSIGPVRVQGRQILVNGEPFFIKGINYQPIPIGYDINQYDIFNDPGIYERDFPLLRSMHCNAIRTWAKVTAEEFLDAAYNKAVKPVYVIMGFPIDNSLDYSNPLVKKNIIDEFKIYVSAYKNHPAVLMWAIGNEQNYWYKGDIKSWYTLVNEMAEAAYRVEGETYHPVTTPNGGVWNSTGPIGDPDFKTDDTSMACLDVWAANIYSGWCFQGRIQGYADKSSKPFWISEYGFPGTDQINQAEGADVLWDEMAANADICCGGTLMAYSDEWWKSGSPATHEDSYGAEWWGIMAVEDNGNKPDIMCKKEAYFRLQNKWADDGGANIAYRKKAAASSVESDEYLPACAVDGDTTKTRWSSQFSDPQWFYVDLGKTYNIGRIILRWERSFAKSYKIQKSNDAVTWLDVYSVTDNDGYTDFIYFDASSEFTARYIRIYCAERGSEWGYSLYEFEVYEPLSRNVSRNKPVYASSIGGAEKQGYSLRELEVKGIAAEGFHKNERR
ncbi:MAG: discoidin domain-containing protein, partial [Candidatus Omnitrophota bacterium]|nr:discoidin domain-containing protein [Candidatus Omnitrophota bacterium]